jgi:hypothetical protein
MKASSQLHALVILPAERIPKFISCKRLSGPKSSSGRLEKEKVLVLLPRIEYRFSVVQPVAS